MARTAPPSPYDIRSARHLTGLTMQEAANLIYASREAWLAWETNTEKSGNRPMHPAFAELFAFKVGLKKCVPLFEFEVDDVEG